MTQTSKTPKEDLRNIERPISSNGVETIMNNLPKWTWPGPCNFTGEFSPTFQDESDANSAQFLPEN